MRKIICFLLTAIVLLPTAVYASDEYASVDLEVCLGSYVAYVNGETMPIEAPFLKNGYTMVPVEAISAAFDYEQKEKVTYNDITIEFSENNTLALVDKEEQYMPVPATKVNGSLMVPIRFVCDTFNALIEFESETGIVKVSKSADFTELFNKPLNGFWCNEDYGWMLQLSTDYDHVSGVYDGSLERFINSAGDAAFSVITKKNEYQSVEQIRNYILAQNSGEILRDESIFNLSDGTKAFYVEFEDSSAVLTIHGDYMFAVEFITTTSDKFELYREEAKAGLESLTFKIDESKKPENISTLNEGGFKLYTDKLLGFTVNRMESWTEPEYTATNKVVWEYKKYDLISKLRGEEIFDGSMSVSVFSQEEGDTPQSLVNARKNKVMTSFNKKYLKDVSIESFVKKDDECAQLSYSIVYNGKKQYNKIKYFVKDGYVIIAEYYVVFTNGIDENVLGLDEIETMFDSIRIKDVNAEKLGKVIDISRRFDSSLMQKYQNDYGNFEICMPAAWVTVATGDSVSTVDLKKSMEVEAEKINITSLENAKAYYSKIYKNAVFSKEKFVGNDAYKLTCSQADSKGDMLNTQGYIFTKNKQTYFVRYTVKEVYESAENRAFLNNIVSSFKLFG